MLSSPQRPIVGHMTSTLDVSFSLACHVYTEHLLYTCILFWPFKYWSPPKDKRKYVQKEVARQRQFKMRHNWRGSKLFDWTCSWRCLVSSGYFHSVIFVIHGIAVMDCLSVSCSCRALLNLANSQGRTKEVAGARMTISTYDSLFFGHDSNLCSL